MSFDVTDTENSSGIISVGGSSPLMRNLGKSESSGTSVKEKLGNGLVNWLGSIYNEMKRLRSDRLKSTAGQALLSFVSKAEGQDGWEAVEKRFVAITATNNGLLPRSKFGECIGMDSEKFASVLFDALAIRRNVTKDEINQEELREFYEQISDQNFNSRLQTFFDMIDKDTDGRITEDEVREIISLSSSANNLTNIQERADEYAALLMEELDPENIGYIAIESLEYLFMLTEFVNTSSDDKDKLSHLLSLKHKTTRDPNPFKRWHINMTWMDLAKPIALGAYKRLIRTFRFSISTVTLLKVAVYPGNLIYLHMSKPRNFKCKSGQYMFVNCSAVSSSKWHPFYITSAPQDDYLSVHIKSIGDWTEGLVKAFSKVCDPPQARDTLDGANNFYFSKIMIDGPYDAPAQDYKNYGVVLLVGFGIGASPMMSIIKDISNYIEAKEHEMETRAQKHQQGKKESFKTRKAYFYWLTETQGSYSWFRNIMNEIVEQDTNKVIELYSYCTSIYETGDVRSAFISMLQSLNHARNGVDIVSGARVMTHFAKPNWKNVYKKIVMDHPGSHVGVFYCGELALAKELRDLALEFTHKTATRFSFHKENFYPQC